MADQYTDAERQQALFQGLIGLGQGLSRGPTETPTSFMQNLARGGAGFAGGVRSSLSDVDRRNLLAFKKKQQELENQVAIGKLQVAKQRAEQGKLLTPEEMKQQIALARAKGEAAAQISAVGRGRWETQQDPNTGAIVQVNTATGETKQAPSPTVSKGQEAMDKAFGKEMAEFSAGGGFADVEKGLSQLDDVIGSLESGKENLTGPLIGMLPDSVRATFKPESAQAQDAVEEVVQRNLRLVLGAQFTEREGARLISRAYNPRLSEEENAKRVKRLRKSISDAYEAKKRANEYFEENGTLRGYKGSIPTASKIEKEAFGDVMTTKTAPKKEVPGRKNIRIWNPNTGRLE